jgi:hypothetical protein
MTGQSPNRPARNPPREAKDDAQFPKQKEPSCDAIPPLINAVAWLRRASRWGEADQMMAPGGGVTFAHRSAMVAHAASALLKRLTAVVVAA